MQDRSGGTFRWAPQETLNEIAEKADPLLNVLVFLSPYVAVLAFLFSLLVGALWLRNEKVLGPHFEREQERAIRSIPLGVGIWGLIFMHLLFIAIPRVPQGISSNAYARDAVEIVTMAFAFFLMYGILNIFLRCALDKKLRKKLNILDKAILAQTMAVLGLGLYVWATVRHGSLWTGAVAWQHFVDSWMFSQGKSPPALSMPSLAKLYMFLGPLAAATMLQSRVVAISLFPDTKLWRESALFTNVEKSAGEVVAGAVGVSVDGSRAKTEGAAGGSAPEAPDEKQD
jgi:nitrate reductase gamma subunit